MTLNSARNSALTEAVADFMSNRDLFARWLGIELINLSPGHCHASMQLTTQMVNGLGLPHGAAIFALADFAFAAACNSYGRKAVALSMDVHFLSSPKPETKLKAEASEVRCGKRTGLYRIKVTDEDNNLVADVHGMAYRKDERFID